MKTGWRIILTIVVLVILLGAICFGVGLLTGADSARITQKHFLNSAGEISSFQNAIRKNPVTK